MAPPKKSGAPTFEDLAGNQLPGVTIAGTTAEPFAQTAGYGHGPDIGDDVKAESVRIISHEEIKDAYQAAGADIHDPDRIQILRHDLLDKIAEQGRSIQELKAELRNVPFASKEGIHAMIMGTAYCPECGIRLNGGSQTGVRGTLYDHDFQAGSTCQYLGRKFKPPTAFLELVPKPLKK